MSDTQHQQHTPPGGWPPKGKDASPPEYFDDKKAPSKDDAQKPIETNDATKSDKKETKEVEEASKGDNNPLDDLKKGLSQGKKDAPKSSDLKEVEPEPLTEEEKKKLTPGGNVPDVGETSKDVEGKSEDISKEAKDKTEALPQDAKDTTDSAPKDVEETTEKAAKGGDGITDDVTKGAEDVTDEATKEGEEAAKGVEGVTDETTKEGEEAAKGVEGVTDEATKEGEEPAKGVEGVTDEAAKEGEETAKGAEEGVENVADEAAKEGEDLAEDAPVDLSILKGGKVNKGGNVVDENGKVVGRIKEGVLANLVGKRVDEKGIIWNDSGKQIGQAELIPDDDRDAISKDAAPFEAFPDATVDGEGYIVFNNERVGKVIDGDLKRLRGMKVDPDGDILDRGGNVVGKAERWEPEAEPEPEPEQEVDRSILAGKRVNKAGNVVDGQGNIFGRVVEGDAKSMIGRMCDKKGNILSESGDVIGRAEVVPEGEREGLKEGPFAELSGCTVTKEGKVVTPGGDVVGRLVKGDPKVLFGRAVDEDGDICDKNGNVLGKAERWEEPEVEKRKGPMAGRRVNREGNVVDEDGNLIGKLTSGELSICAGKEIDDDGDVVDGKGKTVGHVSLIEDIPKKEEESPEDKQKREQAEQDKKLAQQMSYCLTQCLDKVKPICSMITQKIEKAERTPKEELDEEELVKEVRPLIEEGGKILQEANGIIRGLDPDGRIQANAKHRTATRDASPEEYHLADILKELTGTVTTCIDNAKKKIEDMPHAKKELNPLWGLLSEPLFQILAAVGLLLNGVLGLVGRLLSGLGLGGLVDSLLGGLGVKNILEALGVGGLTDSLTGKNQKGGGKKKGGLLGLGG